tara:strand:- start:26980 stop:27966 length:987 start_codon:yes stop_codon:yes gene_type:complete
MINIGVLGAGHLGKIHLKCLNGLPELFNIVGFYDPNEDVGKQVNAEFGFKYFSSIDDLLKEVDAIDIVTPTLNHYDCALQAINASKHIFVEKPITESPEQALELMKLCEKAQLTAQVGHVERFNPAFIAAQDYIQKPMFIETHRLAEFNPRGTDVPVVLDLMIHDIDIVLHSVPSEVKSISASGVAVVSDSPDIANARIEFENGCVANLTASRISLKNMRKTRLFQKDAYITIDFLEKESEIVRMQNEIDQDNPYAMIMDLGNGKKKQIYFEKPESLITNAIQEELRNFGESINKKVQPNVTLRDGYKALHVACQILESINLNLNVIA